MFLKAGVACCLVAAALSAGAQARVDRAATRSTERLTEWLGPLPAPPALESLRFSTPVWSSPLSMDVESQAAFQLARARFAVVTDTPATKPFLDGVAWHLQSRIVEELFDLEHQRPGHHAIELPLFGDHVRWGMPSLVVSRQGRDERVDSGVAHAADAVATLENVVGWPALAAALRVLANTPPPVDPVDIQANLESSLGVPLGWFFAALDPAVQVNHAVSSVTSAPAECGSDRCVRTTVDLVLEGAALFPDEARAGALKLAVRLDFGREMASTVWWNARQSERMTVESAVAPVAVRLDPDRTIRLETNRHDQEWLATPGPAHRPVKTLAAWLVWLQHAVLTYAVLL